MKKRDILVFILILGLDQITKIMAFANDSLNVEIIKDFFYLGQVKNTGAAWGVLEGNMLIFYVVTLIAVVYIFRLYKKSSDKPRYLQLATLLLLAGAIGNFIDRIMLGYVRDFLDFYIFGYDFPLFNIADSALVIGVITLIFYVVKHPHEDLI
ncbi:MAG: signal peptidase II [Erysipelothrix sp.]|nr:signal peptidase II [Erysipelothrix sp.]